MADLPDLDSPAAIERLVTSFYGRLEHDDLLGPVFRAEGTRMPHHIDTMVTFWSWQVLGIPGYEGDPMRAHARAHAHGAFTPAHFDRWVSVFHATIDESFAGVHADLAKARAVQIARTLDEMLRGVTTSEPEVAPVQVTMRRKPDA